MLHSHSDSDLHDAPRFSKIILLHGKGGSPNGSVLQIEQSLHALGVALAMERWRMPHSDPDSLAERSVDYLAANPPDANALVIGISLGGTVACRLQEIHPTAPHVIAISSPTWADGVRVERRVPNRISIFGTHDDVIAGRTSDWPALADTFEFAWLTHDTDAHKLRLARMIAAYVNGGASALRSAAQAGR